MEPLNYGRKSMSPARTIASPSMVKGLVLGNVKNQLNSGANTPSGRRRSTYLGSQYSGSSSLASELISRMDPEDLAKHGICAADFAFKEPE